MSLKKAAIDSEGYIDFSELGWQHEQQAAHLGLWAKGKNTHWLGIVTAYIKADNFRVVYIGRNQRTGSFRAQRIEEGMVLEEGSNQWTSGNHGFKYRSYYLVHSRNDSEIVIELFSTAYQAVRAQRKYLKEKKEKVMAEKKARREREIKEMPMLEGGLASQLFRGKVA